MCGPVWGGGGGRDPIVILGMRKEEQVNQAINEPLTPGVLKRACESGHALFRVKEAGTSDGN